MAASLWVPDRRDVIYIDHSPHAGSEMPGEHPMLVMSTQAFNDRTGIVIGLPMTHSPMNESNPFAVKLPVRRGEAASYVLTHQPKSFDWRVRTARPHPMRQVSVADFQECCDRLNAIVSIG
jgi:mRNA interferase MazF